MLNETFASDIRFLSRTEWVFIAERLSSFILLGIDMTTKKQELQEAFKSIEKQFGKGAIMRMGDNANVGLVNTFHS